MINKKRGFTLVELLAVIVILAIILVIAVPKIMNVIKDTTKASLESSAKMVAAQVENQYTVAQTLGKEFRDSGSCMEDWAGLNDVDYESCRYEIEDGNATVTIGGKGKFKGLSICNGTRSSATAIEGECEDNSGVAYLTELLAQESTLNNGLFVDDTSDQNIRYRGSNPNNRVYFNCKDTATGVSYGSNGYDYASACEVWRIIGIFKTFSDEVDTIGVNRIKIVRDQALSRTREWDTASDGVFINQWGETTLTSDNTTIYNGAYLKQYLNDGEASYYNSLSSIAKAQITDSLWYTGEVKDSTASKVYLDERSNSTVTEIPVNYTTKWVGKIGLIYPSDFGYAGINCGNYTIFDYDNTNSCGKTSNWLTPASGDYWTISPGASRSNSAWVVYSDGFAHNYYSHYVYSTSGVRPALYLASNIQIIGGNGGTEPFRLAI